MAKLTPEFFSGLSPSSYYLEQIHDRVWLMDNHKWAYWVWETHRAKTTPQKRYGLLHFDYHFDAINDFHDDADMVASLESAGLEIIKEWLDDDENTYIRYDSFIAPAIIRRVVGDVHFFCKQTSDETEIGFYSDFPAQYGARQSFYDSIESAARAPVAKPYIFDLCLDLFNLNPKMEYQGDPWPPEDIQRALIAWRELIIGADLITISLSFGCSGTEQQTQYLAKATVPMLLDFVKSRDWQGRQTI
jgi:UPF0489 domain